jgi:LmbE family N-acetylglucosaminyl deacetylase
VWLVRIWLALDPGGPARGGARRGQAACFLPGRGVLAVVAHPDDETFGLGAVLDRMVTGGTVVHVLCYTRGEASTLNQSGADLRCAREQELQQASRELGVATVTLLDYLDGRLGSVPPGELAGHATAAAARVHADDLLVFDDTGITGHPDHRAATRAAVQAAAAGLPVLAWALPAAIAGRLREETGQPFARPAAVAHRPVRPGGPGQAAPGRPPARDSDIARRGAMAAAAAAGRLRAPALAHPASLIPGGGPAFSSSSLRIHAGGCASRWFAERA